MEIIFCILTDIENFFKKKYTNICLEISVDVKLAFF